MRGRSESGIHLRSGNQSKGRRDGKCWRECKWSLSSRSMEEEEAYEMCLSQRKSEEGCEVQVTQRKRGTVRIRGQIHFKKERM